MLGRRGAVTNSSSEDTEAELQWQHLPRIPRRVVGCWTFPRKAMQCLSCRWAAVDMEASGDCSVAVLSSYAVSILFSLGAETIKIEKQILPMIKDW